MKIEKYNELMQKNFIRASYNSETIRVYQAYSDAIAESALQKQKFQSPPFKMERMTWIKPSFLWMMYRSGWGRKDLGQARILAIDISRTGFDWAVKNACLSHRTPLTTQEEWEIIKIKHPVRIQWDPERDLLLNPLHERTIQIGLSENAVELYVNEWTKKITDMTESSQKIQNLILNNKIEEARELLPKETLYLIQP